MSTFSGLFGDAPVDSHLSALFGTSNAAKRPERKNKPPSELNRKSHQKEPSPDSPSDSPSDPPSDSPASPSSPSSSSASSPAPQPALDDDIEGRYFQALTAKSEPASDEVRTQTPTVAKKVDLKESEMDKAERTVFVGNVPASVVMEKPLQKQFKKYFAQAGAVESVRFRSIAFGDALPRKAAYAQKKLHSARDSVNAYVVYREKAASRGAADRFNGKVFEHHHLRVDHVAHPVAKDNKRTIFVGNLDFEAHEEELWKYFNAHTDNDVESVRVVRDAKTNVGKGFALVQFKDSLSVNKCLMLNDKPMAANSKRKLRISRANKHAKPSALSPNHIDNVKKPRTPRQQLTEAQKSKLGRANAVLGKADKATAGKMKVIEGERARKGTQKKKKPRITKRSKNYKK